MNAVTVVKLWYWC